MAAPLSVQQGLPQIVTVFGGTGFLGRRIVRHVRDKGFAVRIASRHPKRSSGDDPELRSIAADIRERQSIATAVEGAFGVVNAVSLHVERGTETFHAVHVVAAERVAEEARKAGVEHLVHISGIGADAHASSPYICARGEGEQAVRATLPKHGIDGKAAEQLNEGVGERRGDPTGRDVRPG